ncbi:MAG: T9SS type A sorting domain-containing protein, partial [bacterium]
YDYGESGIFSIVSPPPDPIIVTREVEVIVTREANVIYNPQGEERIVFSKDVEHGLEWVRFERIPLPQDPQRGASSLEGKALSISANIDKFPVAGQIVMPKPAGAVNPKVFKWNEAEKKWELIPSVALDNELIFKSDGVGIFAVFDVLDENAPQIKNVKVNGIEIKNGDLISTNPSFTFMLEDDYSLDVGSPQIIVDGSKSISVTSGITVSRFSTDIVVYSLSYIFSEGDTLELGDHTFDFVARDEMGNAAGSYSITLKVVASALADLYVYPNPYSLADGQGIEFQGDIFGSGPGTIRIYDIAGDLVWSQGFTQASGVTWNAVNSAGNTVAPGIYLYLITTTSGEKEIGKIAITN